VKRIVCKFGGSSVADDKQIRKVEEIIRSDPRRRYIVPSAPGKRFDDDTKITDLLYSCYEKASDGEDISEPFNIIRERYTDIATSLCLESLGGKVAASRQAAGFIGVSEGKGDDLDIAQLLDDLQHKIESGASEDYVASRGEYLCGKIIAALLRANFIDPADGILLSDEGRLDEQSYEKLSGLLKGDGLFVIPGFYGATGDGGVKTFSRGGSDITGSIVARAVKADIYENWTDVPGVLMADPSIVFNPKPAKEITYNELRELAYMGAKVIHEEAVFPAQKLNIPIKVLNTNKPEKPGTIIQRKRDYSDTPIAGIAGRGKFTLINIEKSLMNWEVGFGRRILEIIESYKINYEHSPTGIDSMSVIIRDEELGAAGEAVTDEIQRKLEPDGIEIYGGLALIAIVGHGIFRHPLITASIFNALAENDINIAVISQGGSAISLIVGVWERNFKKAVKAIYDALVSQ